MGSQTTFTKKAVRDLVNEVLDDTTLTKSVTDPFVLTTQMNPVTSSTAPYDQPLNPDFIPQNKVEFAASITRSMRNVDDKDIPKLYKTIQDALEEFGVDAASRIEREAEEDEETRRQAAKGKTAVKKGEHDMSKKDTKEEALVRSHIKKILREAGDWSSLASGGLGGSGAGHWGSEDEESDVRPLAHEKNLAKEFPAAQMSKRLGIIHSSYVKYEQQLLNKFISLHLMPGTPRAKSEAAKAAYIRECLDTYIKELGEERLESDPDMNDEVTMWLFTNMDNPGFDEDIFESDGFKEWFPVQLTYDLDEIKTNDKNNDYDEADLNAAESEILNTVKGMGVGYSRLDQDPKRFSKLHNKYQEKLGVGNKLDKGFDPMARSGGRKAMAGRAVGRPIKK